MKGYAHHKRGSLGTIFGFVFIVALVIVFIYLNFFTKTIYIAPTRQMMTTMAEIKNIINSSDSITYVSTIDAELEEHFQVAFEFSYPKSRFKVKATPDGKNISITETLEEKNAASSTVSKKINTLNHSITISFEGGRGYSPDDYWENAGKKSCKDCIKSRDPLNIIGMGKTVTYENNSKIMFIANAKSAPFLFIFEIQKPSGALTQALESFAFR